MCWNTTLEHKCTMITSQVQMKVQHLILIEKQRTRYLHTSKYLCLVYDIPGTLIPKDPFFFLPPLPAVLCLGLVLAALLRWNTPAEYFPGIPMAPNPPLSCDGFLICQYKATSSSEAHEENQYVSCSESELEKIFFWWWMKYAAWLLHHLHKQITPVVKHEETLLHEKEQISNMLPMKPWYNVNNCHFTSGDAFQKYFRMCIHRFFDLQPLHARLLTREPK